MCQFFWETTQKARVAHFCDWCFQYIEPGEVYTRKAWKVGPDQFHIIREHVSPECERDEPEWFRSELQRPKVALTIALEYTVVEVSLIQLDGSTVSVEESILVPKLVLETPKDDDTEILF